MTLSEAISLLKDAGVENPEFDARELFVHFGNFKRHELVSRSIVLDDEIIEPKLQERIKRVPLQYIIGSTGFYRESYKVTKDCLIPREDTEILVDFAVNNIPEGENFIDLCTGSGCIAISTLCNTKKTNCVAIDISQAALFIAEENAKTNGVSDRIELRCADALHFCPPKKVFAVLSNPPYVTESEYNELSPELYYEPKIALVGRDEGLEFYKRIVPMSKSSLKPSGFIAFEIGNSQAEALRKIAEENEMSAEILTDFSGNARVAVLKNL